MKSFAEAARIPLGMCPVCGHKINAASHLSDPEIYATPNAGDNTVCIYCCVWLVFRDDLTMRRMTSREIEDLEEEERETLIELSRAISRVNELKTERPKIR